MTFAAMSVASCGSKEETVAIRALPNGTEYLFTAIDMPREDKLDMPPRRRDAGLLHGPRRPGSRLHQSHETNDSLPESSLPLQDFFSAVAKFFLRFEFFCVTLHL